MTSVASGDPGRLNSAGMSHGHATREASLKLHDINLMSTTSTDTIRVAVVEDEEALRASLVSLLNHTPGFCCVGEFSDGRSAVEGLPSLRADVILMDIQLPRMRGIECTRALKDVLPDTPVLMFTMFADDELVFEALEAGAVGYVLKRATPEYLLSAVSDAKAGGSPMTSLIARKVVQRFHKPRPVAPTAKLSPREEELLQHLAKGRSYKEAAAGMGVSLDTVRTYIRRIYEKLQVNSRQGAVERWREESSG
jgi:DNA-binding NarL/FixJ family response regulator